MESYQEWRVTVYVFIFVIFIYVVTPFNYPNYIENQILEGWPLTTTLQIVKMLRFGTLAINSNCPIFSVG